LRQTNADENPTRLGLRHACIGALGVASFLENAQPDKIPTAHALHTKASSLLPAIEAIDRFRPSEKLVDVAHWSEWQWRMVHRVKEKRLCPSHVRDKEGHGPVAIVRNRTHGPAANLGGCVEQVGCPWIRNCVNVRLDGAVRTLSNNATANRKQRTANRERQ
jgi:hypothetical protein